MSRNKNEKCLIVVAFLLFFVLLTSAYFLSASVNKGHGDVSVIFLQTKNDADCTLLFQEDAAVMIDTGEDEDAEHILDVLKANHIQKLDYLILSHGDKDHIGSAKRILEEVEVLHVVEPYYEENDELTDLNDFMEENKIHIIYPTHNKRIRVGEIRMTVFPPLEKKYSKENNYSLAVLVAHKEVHLLFTGDALKKRSEELERIHWPSIDVYKVPHHGRANRETENLMTMVAPTYAVVTSDGCDSIVKECAEQLGAKLLFTRKEEITMVIDGRTIVRK